MKEPPQKIKNQFEGMRFRMKQKIRIGLLLGVAAGIVDVLPMALQKLPWDACLSAFLLWSVAGFMLAASGLKMPAVPKGLLITGLCLLPSVPLIASKEPASLIPIAAMTLVLGSALGYFYHRMTR
jgi:hypothetical protein